MPSARVRCLVLDLLLCSVSAFARDLPRFLTGQLTLRKLMDCHFKSNPGKSTPARVRGHVLLTLELVAAYVESRVVGEGDGGIDEASHSTSASPCGSPGPQEGGSPDPASPMERPPSTPPPPGWEGEEAELLPLLPAAVLAFVRRFGDDASEYEEEVTGLLWLLEEVLAAC